MKYEIYVEYMNELRKKIKSIRNKCAKYGCDFHYEEIEEVIRPVVSESGERMSAVFVVVDVDGIAKVNDWEFIARIEHTASGNIIYKALHDVEIPERYYTCSPYCEHCNSIRHRVDTYLVRNVITNEIKQVGKSCLQEFTSGMSASFAAYLASVRELFQTAQSRNIPLNAKRVYSIDTSLALQCAVEVVRIFGYIPVTESQTTTTKERLIHWFNVYTHRNDDRQILSSMKRNQFNPESVEIVDMAGKVKDCILSCTDNSEYMHNLKVILNMPYIGYQHFGLIASAIPTYYRMIAKMSDVNNSSPSEYVGNIGDKISIQIDDISCITSWDTCYDGYHTVTTYLYKILDEDSNEFIWKTSKNLNLDTCAAIAGTVQKHAEYNGVKQTWLTRCKVNR